MPSTAERGSTPRSPSNGAAAGPADAPSSVFASTVGGYARYRSGYPGAEVAALASQLGVGRADTVLDLGCGTGQLTLPLARIARRVVAIDPVPAMIGAGREAALEAGLTNIDWQVGEASQVAGTVEAGARLATFAASFHWTDRPATLAALDAVLAPGGAVVVIDDDLDDAELPDWDHAITEVRARFGGLDPAPGAITRQPLTHRDVLARSAFPHVRSTTWSWTRRLTVEQVIGLQLTYSFSSPARLGDRLDDFCAQVGTAVRRLHPDGVVTEPLRVQVLTAARDRP